MNESPGQLSEELQWKANEFGTITDQLTEILKRKPAKWMEIRASVESDTRAERNWSATEDGIKETVFKLRLKALEKQMSAIRTRLKVLSDESHNLY